MNTTPLRLVAVEEGPPAEDEQCAAPVTMMSEQDAITRKVPESEIRISLDNLPSKPNRYPRLKTLLSAGALVAVLVVVVIALVMKGKSASTPASVGAIGSPVPVSKKFPEPLPSLIPTAPAVASSSRSKAVPETIRLVITAEPMETELSLDGNVLAGHRMNLEVPKDRGIHVVSAAAPGYIPFNQQVSFSTDVVLKISLHRAHTLPVRQAARPRPSQIESGPKGNVRPAAGSPVPGLAPGMNLDGPPIRTNGKPIDERNPYKP